MTGALELAVDALAVQRVTRLVTEDTIFERQRDWIAMNAPDRVAYLVTCPHCVSIYAGAGAVVLRRLFPRAWHAAATALALSAATSLKTEVMQTLDRGA